MVDEEDRQWRQVRFQLQAQLLANGSEHRNLGAHLEGEFVTEGVMTQRIAVGLTVVNLILLVGLLAQNRPLSAQGTLGVLRGSGLEIVDKSGRVRASVTVYPEDSTSAALSRPSYPEVVVFRLHDRNGKPTVKLDTHEAGVGVPKGSGLGLLGDSDDTQAFIGTVGPIAKIEVKNRNSQRQEVKP